MSDSTISFLVLGAVVLAFVWNKLPVEVVAVGGALALYAFDVINVNQAFAGFGDPTVVFIASLFVVSEGLDATGVTAWAGQQLVQLVGDSRTRLIVVMMTMVALLTALISVNGAVAALLPMAVVTAVRVRRLPSQLLMPLAFGAHAGSMLTLTGTPINVIVSEAAVDAGVDSFGYFDFALVGIPLLVGAIAIVVLFGERLLPDRHAETMPRDLSDHARTLMQHYRIEDYVLRLRVQEESPYVGMPDADLTFDSYADVSLVGVQHTVANSRVIAADDVIVVRGDPSAIDRLGRERGLVPAVHMVDSESEKPLIGQEYGVAEVVIPPRSNLVGMRVFPGMVTESGDFVILAVHGNGSGDENIGKPHRVAEGDTLLLQGRWDALDKRIEANPNVLVVDSPRMIRRQAVPLGPRAGRAVIILAVMVLLLATSAMPSAVAALLAAGAMVLSGVVPLDLAYRSISWTTVVLIGAMIPLSNAMRDTGAADKVADGLIDVVGQQSPHLLLLGLFVITATLGQLISNTATALIVIPIALSAAAETDVSPRPVLMSVTVAAAAAFLTPVATPANMFVMGPAGYRFGDYWRLGLPMLMLFMLVSVLLVPVFWSF